MKLTIYAGDEFSNDFAVISDDGVTPEELSDGDTASIKIYTQGNNPSCVINDKPLTLIDKDNGLFNLTLTPDDTSVFVQRLGFEEDRYSPLSNYIGIISFNLASGKRKATIYLYVKETPQCQIEQ